MRTIQAAYAPARPAIAAEKKVLVLTELEFDYPFKCFRNGYGDGEYVSFILPDRRLESGICTRFKEVARLWSRKK